MSGWSSAFQCGAPSVVLGACYCAMRICHSSTQVLCCCPGYCCLWVWREWSCCFLCEYTVCAPLGTHCFRSQKCTFSLAMCSWPTRNPHSSLLAVVPGHSRLGSPADLTSSPGCAVRFTALSNFRTRPTDPIFLICLALTACLISGLLRFPLSLWGGLCIFPL